MSAAIQSKDLFQRAIEVLKCQGSFSELEVLNFIGSLLAKQGIPFYDTTITYYGSTNNIETVTYSLGGDTVAVLTITYVGGGAANDDKVATTVVTYP